MKYFEEKAGARPYSEEREGKHIPVQEQPGMALIDWFAGQIISGMFEFEDEMETARWTYSLAKAMMDEREGLLCEEENDR